MPAPTAKKVEADFNTDPAIPLPEAGQDEELLLDAPDLPDDPDMILQRVEDDTAEMIVDEEDRPRFAPGNDVNVSSSKSDTRRIPISPHRFTPLKNAWISVYTPLVQHLKLQVRMNPHRRLVELRTSQHTTEDGALQRGEDFIRAFNLGFEVDDAIALLRMDDIYIETFEIKDVRQVMGKDAQSRAIGRIAGKDGKTKFAIENASRTRLSVNDSKISILGNFQSIKLARESIVSLILGKPPSKVYGNLRTVAARQKERF